MHYMRGINQVPHCTHTLFATCTLSLILVKIVDVLNNARDWPLIVVRMSRKHNEHALSGRGTADIGVATLANKNAPFVTPVDCIHRFDAH